MTPPVSIGVSGCSGFIGRHASEALISSGMKVVAIRRSALMDGRRESAVAVVGECDVILHLAARAHILDETSPTPLADYRMANRDATLALANAAAQAGVHRFVFVSSIGVNGNSNVAPFRAGDSVSPQDDYAISKHEAELGLQQIAAQSGLEVVIVRPPLVYGPQVKGNFLRLLGLCASGLPLPLASVTSVRSLISVWNLCDLLTQCVRQPTAAGKVFLAADGEDIALPQLICTLASGMGKRCRLFPAPIALLRAGAKALGKGAAFDKLTESLRVDITETQRVLGWQPPVPLRAGLLRTAQWYAGQMRNTDDNV